MTFPQKGTQPGFIYLQRDAVSLTLEGGALIGVPCLAQSDYVRATRQDKPVLFVSMRDAIEVARSAVGIVARVELHWEETATDRALLSEECERDLREARADLLPDDWRGEKGRISHEF